MSGLLGLLELLRIIR